MKEESKGEIVIYKKKGGKTALEVKLQQETVWLTQVQMSQLFDKDRRTISEHVNNIYKEKELQRDRTTRKFRIVQKEGKLKVEREVDFFNLDVTISVGYRVKSQRGTQFRIWATRVLQDHLIKDYSINQKRLQEQNARLAELQDTVNLMGRVIQRRKLDKAETAGLLNVITEYSDVLDRRVKYGGKSGNKGLLTDARRQDKVMGNRFSITYENYPSFVFKLKTLGSAIHNADES